MLNRYGMCQQLQEGLLEQLPDAGIWKALDTVEGMSAPCRGVHLGSAQQLQVIVSLGWV